MQELKYWYDSPENRQLHQNKNKNAAKAYHRAVQENQKKLAQKNSSASTLLITEGDAHLGVRGAGFEIVFSYPEAGPISMISEGNEWLYRAPRPALWRATTENDKGNQFSSQNSAWLAADSFPQCTGYSVLKKSDTFVSIEYMFTFSAVPNAKVSLTYSISAGGNLQVQANYYGSPNAPELPCFGIRFATPEPATKLEWVGFSGETYPDRKLGASFGMHTETIHIPNYLVPQECGMHCDTYNTKICKQNSANQTTASLQFLADKKPFAISALPYTAQELENALHKEDLPPITHTNITVLGFVRGVGGIDSWGSVPEDSCRISGVETHMLSFFILL